MKTNEILVNTLGEGMVFALEESERAGFESGLDSKEQLRLRLLSEELFGMMKSIVGNLEAIYWIEYEHGRFDIHLKAEVDLTQESYAQLLEVSSTGKNAAVKGFMNKIKNMIAVMMLPQKDIPDTSMLGYMSLGCPGYYAGASSYAWTMTSYRSGLDQEGKDAEEEKDELERSIVANIADDIKVSIVNDKVEIVISKTFN